MFVRCYMFLLFVYVYMHKPTNCCKIGTSTGTIFCNSYVSMYKMVKQYLKMCQHIRTYNKVNVYIYIYIYIYKHTWNNDHVNMWEYTQQYASM